MEIDTELPKIPTLRGKNGGARAGAGRKPLGYVKPEQVVDFEKARARNEAAKAERNEFDLAVLRGQYVAREGIIQAGATMKAAFAQAIRSIPDALESEGIAPEVCIRIDAVLTAALEDLHKDLQMMSGEADDE